MSYKDAANSNSPLARWMPALYRLMVMPILQRCRHALAKKLADLRASSQGKELLTIHIAEFSFSEIIRRELKQATGRQPNA
ncbi:MAG: hypothetical protein HYY83_03225 [Deltaproteobacteria bacterium]|nr:hypothetical protein [Deltaproteobacteria bacterium]